MLASRLIDIAPMTIDPGDFGRFIDVLLKRTVL
jgi:hypothetical protein